MDYHKLFPIIPNAGVLAAGRIYSEPLYQSGGKWDRLQAMPANLNWMSELNRPDYRGSLFDARQSRFMKAAKKEFEGGSHRLMALAGVTTVISQSGQYDPGLALISKGETLVYKVANAVPLASFPKQFRSLNPGEDALETLAKASQPVGRTMLMEGWNGAEVLGKECDFGIQQWGQGRIELKTSGDGGMLRIAESFDPGWSARVDGRLTKILRADYLFMAIQVPSGRHQIVLSYQPRWFTEGILLSILSFVLWIGFCVRKRGSGCL
jgi:hypothetical protein